MAEAGWQEAGDAYYLIEGGKPVKLSAWVKKGRKLLIDTRDMTFRMDAGIASQESCEEFLKDSGKVLSALRKLLGALSKEELERMTGDKGRKKREMVDDHLVELAQHEFR